MQLNSKKFILLHLFKARDNAYDFKGFFRDDEYFIYYYFKEKEK